MHDSLSLTCHDARLQTPEELVPRTVNRSPARTGRSLSPSCMPILGIEPTASIHCQIYEATGSPARELNAYLKRILRAGNLCSVCDRGYTRGWGFESLSRNATQGSSLSGSVLRFPISYFLFFYVIYSQVVASRTCPAQVVGVARSAKAKRKPRNTPAVCLCRLVVASHRQITDGRQPSQGDNVCGRLDGGGGRPVST